MSRARRRAKNPDPCRWTTATIRHVENREEQGEPTAGGDLHLRSGRFIDEFDGPAEVHAAFRTQRRAAVGYFVVFLLVTLAVPLLAFTLDWWSSARLVGGMSPSFLMAAVGLYVFFFVLGLLAATLGDGIEDRMLGTTEIDEDWP